MTRKKLIETQLHQRGTRAKIRRAKSKRTKARKVRKGTMMMARVKRRVTKKMKTQKMGQMAMTKRTLKKNQRNKQKQTRICLKPRAQNVVSFASAARKSLPPSKTKTLIRVVILLTIKTELGQSLAENKI